MNCIYSAWIKGISVGLALVMILLVPVSCASTSSEQEEEASVVIAESWQIGEHWQYSPQAMWGEKLAVHEVLFGDVRVAEQYISLYDLHTREKQRVREIPADYLVSEPSIYDDRIVWSSCYYSQEMRESPQKDISALDWDVFLLDLKTGKVTQITAEEHAQTEPKIYGDTIIWLDNRHGTGDRYPYPPPLDVYAYDLNTREEKRLTSATTAEGYDSLSISGNLVAWTDIRHADPDVISHPSNEPDYNNEIYVYDLTANKEHRITDYPGNDHYPAIDGNRIVWLRQSDYRQADIYVLDLQSGQERQVTHSGCVAYSPSIHGDRVVWSDARISQGNTTGDIIEGDKSGAAEIYLCDLYTELETLLVPSATEGEYKDVIFRQVWLNPVIHGDFLVYTLSRQIGPIVYAMRLNKK